MSVLPKKVFSFNFWFAHVWISNRTEALRHLYDKTIPLQPDEHSLLESIFEKYYLCTVEHCIILSYDKLESKNLNLAVSICPRIIEFPTVSENIKHEYLVTNANSFQNIWLFFFIKKSFPRSLFFLASDLNLRRIIADTRYYAAKPL